MNDGNDDDDDIFFLTPVLHLLFSPFLGGTSK